MKREYDLIDDLGPKNWIDVTAGEAVLLGWLLRDPELTMRGTQLADMLTNIPFDSEDFAKVEALAISLGERLMAKKKEKDLSVFIDEICEYEGRERSDTKWEYDLILAEGRYEIKMYLPEYIGQLKRNEREEKVERIVRNSYQNPGFDKATKAGEVRMMGTQKMDASYYYTDDGRLICRELDFNHECGWKRGFQTIYYIDDYAQAIEAWTKIKSILGRKK